MTRCAHSHTDDERGQIETVTSRIHEQMRDGTRIICEIETPKPGSPLDESLRTEADVGATRPAP